MSRRFWLGYRTILLGWSFVLLALAWLFHSDIVSLGFGGVAAVLVFAGLMAWEWAQRVKTDGHGNETQARHHALALAATGVVVGLPLTALALFALPGLFSMFGASGLDNPHTGYVIAIVVALGVSWVLAAAWKANCAPTWLG